MAAQPRESMLGIHTHQQTDGPRIGRGPIGKIPPAYQDNQIEGLLIKSLRQFADSRGWLVELFRHDEMPTDVRPVMSYASMTLPGVARGPHEHVNQTDGFAFFGPSQFKFYAWDARPQSLTFGHKMTLIVGQDQPTAIWVPPGVVHAYRNIGEVPGLVFNAPNRLYAGWNKSEPVDEIRHEDADPNPYLMD
jgi:dTDP-4-dehydrorhamnose 3,5-epimerase